MLNPGFALPRTKAAEMHDGIGGIAPILRYAIVDSGDAMSEA
jgi:hypothetical protein